MTSEAATTRRRAPTGWQRAGSLVKEIVFVVVGALLVSSLLRAFVGQMFIIPSESMENTLLVGDRVVVQKITDVQRGDIAVFTDPGGWLDSAPAKEPGPADRVLEFIGFPTASSPEHLIKRVVGMPGDRVLCCDTEGRITVNGTALEESGYLYSDPDGYIIDPSEVRFDVVVPRDRLFVMGDHRDLSADSRCHLSDLSMSGVRGMDAFVPLDNVVGPAVAIAAPLDRASRLRRPATFTQVRAPSSPPPEAPVIRPAQVSC